MRKMIDWIKNGLSYIWWYLNEKKMLQNWNEKVQLDEQTYNEQCSLEVEKAEQAEDEYYRQLAKLDEWEDDEDPKDYYLTRHEPNEEEEPAVWVEQEHTRCPICNFFPEDCQCQ